jgi:hypothetical protein
MNISSREIAIAGLLSTHYVFILIFVVKRISEAFEAEKATLSCTILSH